MLILPTKPYMPARSSSSASPGFSAICAAVEEQVWPMLADGRVRLSPETRVPLAEVRRAHEQLVGGDNVGKIVLVH